MANKWVIAPTDNVGYVRVITCYNQLNLLTFDPNFQRDIQAMSILARHPWIPHN